MNYPSPQHHKQVIISHFEKEAGEKYDKGQAEHGGKLWEYSALEMVREAKKENIDGYTYLDVAEEKIIELEAENAELRRQLGVAIEGLRALEEMIAEWKKEAVDNEVDTESESSMMEI